MGKENRGKEDEIVLQNISLRRLGELEPCTLFRDAHDCFNNRNLGVLHCIISAFEKILKSF